MKQLFSIVFLLFAFKGFSQTGENNPGLLTIEKIMQAPEKWIGTSPDDITWNDSGDAIRFSWNPNQDTLTSVYSYSLKSGEIEKVPLEEKRKIPSAETDNAAKTKKAVVRDGNIFITDLKKGTEKELTSWLGRVSSVRFALNDSHVSFLKDQNLFVISLETGAIRQITNFVEGEKEKDKKPAEGQAKWLENQQTELFDVLKERETKEKARENRDEQEKPKQPEKIFLVKSRLQNADLSPSGNYVIYTTINSPQGVDNTSVTHWVTESGYTEEKGARAKVGSAEPKMEMGIFHCINNRTVAINTSSIPGLYELPDYLEDYPHRIPKDSAEMKAREFNLVGPIWNEKEDLALVVALSHDNKDRWILLLDPATGNVELLDRQRDEAWIGGPGIGGSMWPGTIGWMPDGTSVWFQSEMSGYSHLYSVNCKTKEKKALTSGGFEVSQAFLSADKKHFYFTSNEEHPGEKHFYKMPVSGGVPTRITSLAGNNEVVLSPDEKNLAIRYSYANKPWELYIQENKPGAKARQITNSTTENFRAYNWRVPEFVTFGARDGGKIHGRLYRPENPQENGPAVIFVHGAGYLQNAHKWWSQYSREYMFHNFLADNGYTVLDIDYRGSAGYGRDWRTGIYRHMGGKDLSDHVDGAKFLVEKYQVSPEKIGIYGGSYGGFITLMAMFTQPEIFAAGAALRAVTDWAHYNHGYTSNILNTPVEDSIAFVRSSPIYFAGGLEGALLMCHGMVDDNVHFQDIVRLSQRLIELGKDNWELAVYPVEPHGFLEPSSWTDEYKRIFKLFEENLKR